MNKLNNKNMKTTLDLSYALKGHEGEIFYSPIYGDVKLLSINNNDMYPIKTDCSNFLDDGRFGKFEDAECMIFPSKDQRNWDKWLLNEVKKSEPHPKDGEIWYYKNTIMSCVIRMKDNNTCYDYINNNNLIFYGNYMMEFDLGLNARLATDDECEKLIKAEKYNNFIWNKYKEHYRPFNENELPYIVGKVVRIKNDNSCCRLINGSLCDNVTLSNYDSKLIDIDKLFEQYEFVDGSPCGVKI